MINLRMLQPTAQLFIFEIWGPSSKNQIKIATVVKNRTEISTPHKWLENNQVEAQVLIDNGKPDIEFTILQEVKQFIKDNPNAKLLIELPPDDLETAIENRTAAQETLLLKTLAMAVRYLYAAGLDE